MHLIFNVSQMFAHHEPWDCSNSQANLGPQAAKLTWACAREVARDSGLETPITPAVVDAMRDHFRAYGAWDSEDIDAWGAPEMLAMIVQEIASDLRLLGSDDYDLDTCVERYESTNWDSEPEYPRGMYYSLDRDVFCNFWLGV